MPELSSSVWCHARLGHLHQSRVPRLGNNPIDNHANQRPDKRGDQMDAAKRRIRWENRWQHCLRDENPQERVRGNPPDLLWQSAGEQVVPENPEPIREPEHQQKRTKVHNRAPSQVANESGGSPPEALIITHSSASLLPNQTTAAIK